eukprot:4136688-Pyramimonas_sp.AAC.1
MTTIGKQRRDVVMRAELALSARHGFYNRFGMHDPAPATKAPPWGIPRGGPVLELWKSCN